MSYSIKDLIYVCAYFGSKLRFVKELTLLIPKGCTTMYEVCGGLGSFTLNRQWWFDKSVYNEYNEKIFNIIAVLKNEDTRERFIEEVVNIPNSKKDFNIALNHYNNDFKDIYDKVEQAKIVYMLLTQSMNCEKKNWVTKKPISEWGKKHIKNRLRKVAEELKGIDITNDSCFEIIENNKNNSDTFIMADVPYPEDTDRVSKNSYDNETYDWDLDMHKDFVNLVKKINGQTGCKILVCTYDSPTYNKLLEETDYWSKILIKRLSSPSGKKNKKRNIREEYVYINYNNYSDLAKYAIIPIQ
ncbi:DNA adenine methylase [Clostridium botulinum]|nr:DNA adenine methylase [Clostridium botulinum]NFN49265.1 DNA adenine methylase [Clostridium botulinum]